jgi:uncharacterized protein
MTLPDRQTGLPNPCTSCGACCALYRVTFPREISETESSTAVPLDLTIKINRKQRGMKGTYSSSPRCIALKGDIGFSVSCSIYSVRPPPCRIFKVSWENGIENEKCDRAREFWGLKALEKPGLL